VKGEGGPTRVGEVLDGVLEEKGVREQVARMSAMERWEACVGEKIAEVTRPVAVDAGVLFVEVRSSAWLMELDMMKERILERINRGRDQGRIEKIRFRQAEATD